MSVLPRRIRKGDSSRTALAFAIALILNLERPALAELAVPRAPMAVPVTNCNDDGPGSLRDAVFQSVSGDTIDASQLTCSVISLATGYLNVGQSDLTIRGPGVGNLHIVADYHGGQGGVILHSGTGRLTVTGLTVKRGMARGEYGGGCIGSNGSVTLRDAAVRDCVAFGESSSSRGGGISARGVVELDHALVTNSRVYCNSAGTAALGAGVFSQGGLVMHESQLIQNLASGGNGCMSYCAGAFVIGGSITVDGSTIANNSAGREGQPGNAGAICASAGGKYGLTITNSTIANNTATGAFGGIYSNTLTSVRNSTIAFNSANDPNYGAGLHMQNAQADIASSIIALNMAGTYVWDLTGAGPYLAISGSNNLTTSYTIAPPDTLIGNPQLSVLADNGGPTPTIAIAGWSPAVDRGNNNAGLSNDQRGAGFPRVAGAAADIGAFETRGDLIFRSGFD